MNKIAHLLSIACVLGLTLGLNSCDDDDFLAPALTGFNPATQSATVNTLSFSWEAVKDATQYGYELTKEGQTTPVQADVTTKTSVTCTGLEPSTTYTLSVWAYGEYGKRRTSPVCTVTARTDDVIPLDAPQVTADAIGTSITLTWNAVNFASYYEVSYNDLEGNRQTQYVYDTTVTLRALPVGHYTFNVVAYPDAADAAHSQSLPAQADADAVQLDLWSAEGDYTSICTGNTEKRTIVAHADGTYTIKAWYGVEGYDLSFSVDASGNMTFIGPELEGEYVYVQTGTSEGELPINVSYCNFTGNQYNGYMYMYVWGSQAGYDEFSWGVPPVTVDDIVGTYSMSTSGYFYYDDWETFTYTDDEFEITKIDDNTVSVGDFYNEERYNAVLDGNAHTLTIQPCQAYDYYTLAASDDIASPVVGTIDSDGTITFKDWNFWYDGYTYMDSCVTTYSPTTQNATAVGHTLKARPSALPAKAHPARRPHGPKPQPRR